MQANGVKIGDVLTRMNNIDPKDHARAVRIVEAAANNALVLQCVRLRRRNSLWNPRVAFRMFRSAAAGAKHPTERYSGARLLPNV